MKENSNRFILACSSPLLQPDTVNTLGYSGKGLSSGDISQSSSMLETSNDCLKDLLSFFHNLPHSTSHPFVTVDQWNEHWLHSKEKK